MRWTSSGFLALVVMALAEYHRFGFAPKTVGMSYAARLRQGRGNT